MDLSDFDFELPEALIAQRPLARRDDSRLLHVGAGAGASGLADLRFADIERLLAPGSLLVVNDTRVRKARLFGRKESGGRIEALVDRVDGPHRAWALVRASHALRPGATVSFGDGGSSDAVARVASRDDDRWLLEFEEEVETVLQRLGRLPLPPYIRHEPDADDDTRYQTVYAAAPGAVAAPTAGLHFTQALLERLRGNGIEVATLTLEVGAGTFLPVRGPSIDAHRMHEERYRIPETTAAAVGAARAQGRPVVAVGTTSLRALESAAEGNGIRAGDGETRLFIRPGYRFAIVDRLLTNFHLPRSTLLMLVAAFGGLDRIRAAYVHAVAEGYRFFSYGDAMLLDRDDEATRWA